jgi:LemA protein
MTLNKPLIVGGILLSAVILFAMIVSGWYNKAITAEENINTSLSNISKEEQRRVDLFNNLVDAVESYNAFERSTLVQVIEARAIGNAGNVEQAMLMLAAVVEAYPELKSVQNYDKLMLEFSITENRLASYREQYNTDVRAYNRFIRSFPVGPVLSMIGYTRQDYQYLEFNVDNNDARNLFTPNENS